MSFKDANFPPTPMSSIHALSNSTAAAAYSVLALILAYYLLHSLEYNHLPLSELFWNSFVHMTPSRIISALDKDFREAAKEEQGNGGEDFDPRGHAGKSNALRRIIGFEGAGITTLVQRTRALSGLGDVFKSKATNSLPGLGNWDNSCYQNSVLQGLASLNSLPRFLRHESFEARAEPTVAALGDITNMLNDPENFGRTFWTPAQLKSMSSWQQQDAQEYFSKVLDEVEKDIAKIMRRRPRYGGLNILAKTDHSHEEGNAQGPDSKSQPSSAPSIWKDSKVSRLPDELAMVMTQNPLEGLLAQRVGCQQCGYVEGLSLVPFNCLTVPLGRGWTYNVLSCLDEFTALELINGVECAKCTLLHAKRRMEHMLSQFQNKDAGGGEPDAMKQTANLQHEIQERFGLIVQALDDEDFSDGALKKCQIPTKNRVSTTKSRQAVVARAPKALTIHVNRSIFDEFTGEQSKNNAHVRFPKRLNLGPWCLGPHSKSQKSDEMIVWSLNPMESMLSNAENAKIQIFGPSYELRAVVTHYGRHENGHYICYRKSPLTAKMGDTNGVGGDGRPWWRLSDESVTQVDEETVLAQGGVFMLFYEQLDPSPASVEIAPEQSLPITSTIGEKVVGIEAVPTAAEAPKVKAKPEKSIDDLANLPIQPNITQTPPKEPSTASNESRTEQHPPQTSPPQEAPNPIPSIPPSPTIHPENTSTSPLNAPVLIPLSPTTSSPSPPSSHTPPLDPTAPTTPSPTTPTTTTTASQPPTPSPSPSSSHSPRTNPHSPHPYFPTTPKPNPTTLSTPAQHPRPRSGRSGKGDDAGVAMETLVGYVRAN